jgi:hypothetical protein
VSLPSVQEAAQRAVSQAGELPWLLPSLLAVGIMGALGVRLARDLEGIRTTRSPRRQARQDPVSPM